MRIKQATKCAVGAMLFSGTLGGVSTAQAGFITWLNSDPSRPEPDVAGASEIGGWVDYNTDDGTYGDNIMAHWADTKVAGSLTGGLGSVSWTASGDHGNFLIMATNSPGLVLGGLRTTAAGNRYLQVTGSQEVNFSVSSSGVISSGMFSVYSMTAQIGIWDSTTQGNNFTGTLTAGVYFINFYAINDTDPYTDWGDLSTVTLNFVVPAPGAMALLGAAGLVGGRRRRG